MLILCEDTDLLHCLDMHLSPDEEGAMNAHEMEYMEARHKLAIA